MFHQDFEDLLYLKGYDILDGRLNTIFFPNPLWASGVPLAVISKWLEQEGPGCTRSQDNLI